MRRAISPVIAVVILVAVTISIAIAVASWLMGLWGSYGSVEQLTVMPDSTLSGDKLTLHIRNTGSKPLTITGVYVEGLGSAQTSIHVGVGDEATKTITLPAEATSGAQYLVKIYTDTGSEYQIVLMAG